MTWGEGGGGRSASADVSTTENCSLESHKSCYPLLMNIVFAFMMQSVCNLH